MSSSFRWEECCAREVSRTEWERYRRFYGIFAPDHEPTIFLGDLGRFTMGGQWVKLAGMFERGEGQEGREKVGERWKGIAMPLVDDVSVSEEMVFDPLVSGMTGWNRVPEESLNEYRP